MRRTNETLTMNIRVHHTAGACDAYCWRLRASPSQLAGTTLKFSGEASRAEIACISDLFTFSRRRGILPRGSANLRCWLTTALLCSAKQAQKEICNCMRVTVVYTLNGNQQRGTLNSKGV